MWFLSKASSSELPNFFYPLYGNRIRFWKIKENSSPSDNPDYWLAYLSSFTSPISAQIYAWPILTQ